VSATTLEVAWMKREEILDFLKAIDEELVKHAKEGP
jgi:hypothetical protein